MPSTSDVFRALIVPSLLAISFTTTADRAHAQRGYVAAIAYSPSTGRIGHTARQARTEEQARRLALQMIDAPDARVYTWARDQWVAIAVVDGFKGSAGFARGLSAEEAQSRTLAECGKRAKGHAYRVVMCFHSSGMQARDLRSIAAVPATSKTGYWAAIAYSPSTGKIGSTAGEAKTKEKAHELALARCKAPDAKVWMWGDQWIAIAITTDGKGTAGFGPGATRKAAQDAALALCRKQGHGAPCKLALAIYSAGAEQRTVAKPVTPPNESAAPAPPAAPQLNAPTTSRP